MHLRDDMTPQDKNENEFMRELSPTLFDQKQRAEDTSPEGYFEEFPDRMMARIENENTKESRRHIPSYVNYRPLSIAAGLALILALIPYFKTVLQGDKGTTETISSTNISIKEMDSDVLASYIDTEDLYATIDLQNNSLSLPQPNTDSDAIIDYLIDEGMTDQLFLETLNTDER